MEWRVPDGHFGFFERTFQREERGVSRGTNLQLAVDNALATVRRREPATCAHNFGQSADAAGILASSAHPPRNLWKCRNSSSSFTTTSCGSRAGIAASF